MKEIKRKIEVRLEGLDADFYMIFRAHIERCKECQTHLKKEKVI